MDGNGLVYLRARYYSPNLGVFPSLDPLEGDEWNPASLNRYMWVQGNIANRHDPSGLLAEADLAVLNRWNSCQAQQGQDCLLLPLEDCKNCCLDKLASIWAMMAPPEAQKGFLDACVADCEKVAKPIADSRCNQIKTYVSQLKAKNNNGRQVLSEAIAYANNTFHYTNGRELADDISCAVTGSRGPNTIFDASGFGAKFNYPGVPAALGKGGWNSDYDDGTDNQAFHLWSYVNTVAQGGDLGILLSMGANVGHECWDLTDEGRSTPDYNLAWAGVILGYSINSGSIAPNDVQKWVATWVGGTKSFKDLMSSPDAAHLAEITTGGKPILCPYIDTHWTIK